MANNKVHPTAVEVTEDPIDDVQEGNEGKVEVRLTALFFPPKILNISLCLHF